MSPAQKADSFDPALRVACLLVWVLSVVRIVGALLHHEPFGAEVTLALVMVIWMTRQLIR